jgi:hypothetical protein
MSVLFAGWLSLPGMTSRLGHQALQEDAPEVKHRRAPGGKGLVPLDGRVEHDEPDIT